MKDGNAKKTQFLGYGIVVMDRSMVRWVSGDGHFVAWRAEAARFDSITDAKIYITSFMQAHPQAYVAEIY